MQRSSGFDSLASREKIKSNNRPHRFSKNWIKYHNSGSENFLTRSKEKRLASTTYHTCQKHSPMDNFTVSPFISLKLTRGDLRPKLVMMRASSTRDTFISPFVEFLQGFEELLKMGSFFLRGRLK